MQRRLDTAFRARAALLTLVGFLASSVALAQSPTASSPAITRNPSQSPKSALPNATSAYIVVDLTAEPNDFDVTQIASFPAAMVSATPVKESCAGTLPTGIANLAFLASCADSDTTSIENRVAAATNIRHAAQDAARDGTTRFITSKGEIVRVVVIGQVQAFSSKDAKVPLLVRGQKPRVIFKEKSLETQFLTDLRSLAKVTSGILGAAETGAPGLPDPATATAANVPWAFVSSHGLREKRATVSVSVEAGQATGILAKPPKIDDKDVAGFLERWDAAQVPQVNCVGALASPRVTPLTILSCRAKESPNIEERVSAIDGLGTLGDSRATAALAELSQHAEPRVRAAALTALSKLKPGAPIPAAVAAGEGAEDAPAKPSVDLSTGPREHWFLSADVPVTKAEALMFDEDTGQVTLGTEPSTFYIGLNFLAGDIKDPKRTFLGNLVVKGLLKASNRPLDSVGIGVGLRGQYLSKIGLNLDVLTPFIAVTFTQEDLEENGEVTRRARRNSELRFGVSLNLDQAAKWFGGK